MKVFIETKSQIRKEKYIGRIKLIRKMMGKNKTNREKISFGIKISKLRGNLVVRI